MDHYKSYRGVPRDFGQKKNSCHLVQNPQVAGIFFGKISCKANARIFSGILSVHEFFRAIFPYINFFCTSPTTPTTFLMVNQKLYGLIM